MPETYVGVNGSAIKVVKAFAGVNDIAREIDKIFVGDENGIARLIYTATPDPFYVYDNGNELVDVTGGWHAVSGTLSHGENYISISSSSTTVNAGATTNSFDILDYKKVHFIVDVSVENDSGSTIIGGFTGYAGPIVGNYFRNPYRITQTGTREYVLDISDKSTGEFDVDFQLGFGIGSSRNLNSTIKLYAMWLTKE